MSDDTFHERFASRQRVQSDDFREIRRRCNLRDEGDGGLCLWADPFQVEACEKSRCPKLWLRREGL